MNSLRRNGNLEIKLKEMKQMLKINFTNLNLRCDIVGLMILRKYYTHE